MTWQRLGALWQNEKYTCKYFFKSLILDSDNKQHFSANVFADMLADRGNWLVKSSDEVDLLNSEVWSLITP